MSKTIAIFPARGGSKRIPGKNIVDFLGRPIISYALEEAKKSGLFDVIHVSTDNDDIASVANSLGADVQFRRPSNLSGDFVTIFPVIKWVLKKFAESGEIFDDVFTIFPCSPLLMAKDLKQSYDLYDVYGRSSGVMAVSEAPSRVEKYFKTCGDMLVPIDSKFKDTRTQDLDPAYYNVGTFTIYPSRFFTHDISCNCVAYKIPFWRATNIDTLDNLRFAELLYKATHG